MCIRSYWTDAVLVFNLNSDTTLRPYSRSRDTQESSRFEKYETLLEICSKMCWTCGESEGNPFPLKLSGNECKRMDSDGLNGVWREPEHVSHAANNGLHSLCDSRQQYSLISHAR